MLTNTDWFNRPYLTEIQSNQVRVSGYPALDPRFTLVNSVATVNMGSSYRHPKRRFGRPVKYFTESSPGVPSGGLGRVLMAEIGFGVQL